MSQHDILNPNPRWQADLQDSMCPNFGFQKKRPLTRSASKAFGGVPYTRELGNTGHGFYLSWIGRSLACVRKLKQFQEQFEDGFFTIVDWDAAPKPGNGRQYVGRFVSEVVEVETASAVWDVQNLQFEEIPTVPMLQYPADWQNWAIDIYPLNDFGQQKLATQGTWAFTQRNLGGIVRTTADDGAVIGDWAQHEWRGYGFQFWGLVGAGQGIAQLFLDGTQVATIGFSAANAVLQPQMLFQMTNVPLDIHRVQIVVQPAVFTPNEGGVVLDIQTWAAGPAPATWTAPSTPSGYTAAAAPCSWFKLRVMR